MDNVAIRKASTEDAAAISGCLLSAFLEYKDQYTEAGFAATTPGPEKILKRLEEGPIWVAALDNQVVGTVSVALRENYTLYVRGMAVSPTARGLGIGDLLFSEVKKYAQEQSAMRLLLSTTPFLHRAIKFYERLGFIRTEEGPNDLYGTPLFSMEMPV